MGKYTRQEPLKVSLRKIQSKMLELCPRSTYAHLVKDHCQTCHRKIRPDIKEYEIRGNFCPKCDQQSRHNATRLKLTEADLDALFRGEKLYEDLYGSVGDELHPQTHATMSVNPVNHAVPGEAAAREYPG